MDLTAVYCAFDGLYAWGRGYCTADQSVAWQKFWSRYEGIYWQTVRDSDGSLSLVSTYGGGMIHPMNFKLVIAQPFERLGHALDELKNALDAVTRMTKSGYRLSYRRIRAEPEEDTVYAERTLNPQGLEDAMTPQTERITRFNALYLNNLVRDAYASGDEVATGLAGQVADEVIDHGRYAEGDRLSPEHERLVNDLIDATPADTGEPPL